MNEIIVRTKQKENNYYKLLEMDDSNNNISNIKD